MEWDRRILAIGQVALALDVVYAFPGLDGQLSQSCMQAGRAGVDLVEVVENVVGFHGKMVENAGKCHVNAM